MPNTSLKRLLILGAGGHVGRSLTARALSLGYQVTVLVRDKQRFLHDFAPDPSPLVILEADARDATAVKRALSGMDVMVSAAGRVTDGQAFIELFAGIVGAAEQSVGFGGRVWMFAGAGALKYPGTERYIADLPGAPRLYQAHLENARRLEASPLDWSLMCPGPMIDGAPRPPRSDLRVATEVCPLELSHFRRWPGIFQAIAFRIRLGELIVGYDDVADAVIAHLDRDGLYRRHRVGIALPTGERARKQRWDPSRRNISN